MMQITAFAAIAALAASVPTSATAQSSSRLHGVAKNRMKDVGGVETIKPQEVEPKGAGDANGWNGAYVGVNAGGSVGTTTGTNVVVPFGTSGQTGK